MADRKKIAAIATTYFQGSHANLIASKFATGFPSKHGILKPRVDLVSLYMDQLHVQDVGMDFAQRHGIKVYPSIRGALTLANGSNGDWPTAPDWKDGELAVDGVIIIGEHGDYPKNERSRRMYPRRNFFEQVCGVIANSGRSIPVFNDKHLAYNWTDAQWIYQRAKELDLPFMAGSSLPVTYRKPELEHQLDTPIEDAISIGFFHSYVGGLESYGFHALEALQCMVERRQGGETGVRAVQCLEGTAVWKAACDGVYSVELVAAAETCIEDKTPGTMKTNCNHPVLFLLEYSDGLRAATLLLPGHLQGFGYAARVGGKIHCTGFGDKTYQDHTFGYLGLNIQEMFLTGQPTYPVERTLLITGVLDALLESRYRNNARIETPQLNISYKSFVTPAIRHRGQ